MNANPQSESLLLISARMAFIFGITLPILETLRRIKQIMDPQYFIQWFDDYLLGGLLIWAALMVYKNRQNASLYLVAVWGMTVGVLCMSLLAEIQLYFNSHEDPGVYSKHIVFLFKLFLSFFAFIGLRKSILACESVRM